MTLDSRTCPVLTAGLSDMSSVPSPSISHATVNPDAHGEHPRTPGSMVPLIFPRRSPSAETVRAAMSTENPHLGTVNFGTDAVAVTPCTW